MNSVTQVVIEHLAADNADLREENSLLREAKRQLVDLVADLAFDLEVAKVFADREFRDRVQRDKREARQAA